MKFVSQYKKYKLWIEPAYHSMDGMGKRTFHAGICAKFDNGMLETQDPKMIETLLKDPMCGVDFAPVKVDESTTIPAPELVDNYAWAKEEKPAEVEVGEFVCDVCGKHFLKKVAMIGHKRSHK